MNDISNLKLTQAHTKIHSLLGSFSEDVRACYMKQLERQNINATTSNIISGWNRGDRIFRSKVSKAQKDLDELRTSIVWPQSLGHTDGLFASVKDTFEEYLFGEGDELSSPDAMQPGSPQSTTSDGNQHPLTDNTFEAPHKVLSRGSPIQSGPQSNTEPPLSLSTAADRGAGDANSETGVLAHTNREQSKQENDLQNIPISDIMCSDKIIECAGDASRAFWQDALEEPASEWHSMALFLKDNHSALFPSPPPRPC